MNTKAATIIAVVEGHGEVSAVPVLIRRVAIRMEVAMPKVPPPIRVKKGLLKTELARTLTLAAGRWQPPGGILILLDADDDCPAQVGPGLRRRASALRPDVPVEVVLANREYEAWFLGGLASLAGQRGILSTATSVAEPESPRGAKERLENCLEPGRVYSETLDQAALTARLDLDLARAACPSLDKCLRALAVLLGPPQLPHG